MSKHHVADQRSVPGGRRFFSLTSLIVLGLAVAAMASAQPVPRKPASSVPRTSNARMKGIWEPVNYGEDLTLESVYFVTPRVGWASGERGTIIKTVDGGAHWTPQLGGTPQNEARAIGDLRFVDQRHGFAVQSTGIGDHSLLRTVDGRTWRSSGTVPQHRGDYVFTSPTVGFASTGNEIRRTRDAGRSWQKVMDCATSVSVNGLSRNTPCSIESLSFPTPQIGYGVGTAPGGIKGVFIARTTDGGNTWAIWRVLDEESAHQGFTTFTDPNTGFLCTYSGKFFSTSDGGRSWDGVAGVDCGGNARGKFADPETGWTLASQRWNYTTDGGSTWASRAITFPAGVNAFSLPRRDRGYAVGDHGMVYRYSIVPVTHTAANSFDAPIVGAFTSPLDNQVEEFVADVGAFSTENGGPPTDAASGDAGTASSGGMDTSASDGSGTTGSTSGAVGSGSGDASGTTTAFDAGSAGASAGKAKRGGNRLGQLQALLDAIGTSMPDFLARYRNLNLLFEGTRTAAGMPSWLQTVKGGLAAFRSSTDKSSAAAALAQIVSAADSLKNQTSVAFMQTSFTQGPEDAASGFSSTPPPATAAAASVDSAAAGAKSAVADSVANAAKAAAKKKLGGLLKNPFGKH
jgi:photosystem II stability/assembly factor-like uncharacterized protein